MGEVYRAEDMTLDHPVALKFLSGYVRLKPDATDANRQDRLKPDTADANGNTLNRTDDDARLAQFHNELRIARQVSHKNVCRLYDLGEVEGRRFITMEYVDGEDLASLLRRIGR